MGGLVDDREKLHEEMHTGNFLKRERCRSKGEFNAAHLCFVPRGMVGVRCSYRFHLMAVLESVVLLLFHAAQGGSL